MATITIALLSLIVGIQAFGLANANPTWGVYPTEPNQDKPILIVENPQNYTTCTQNSVILNFTVAKPSSWNQSVAPFGSCADGRIHVVNVSLNGVQKFQEWLAADRPNGGGAWNKSYSVSVEGLNPGVNPITIVVIADTLYFNENSTNNTVSLFPMNVTSTLYLNYAPAPSPTLTPITSFYGGGYYGPTSYENYCSFYITVYNPDDQTVYANTMPLKFNITWTTFPRYPLPVPRELNGYYAYKIDDGPFVRIASNQSANDVFYQRPANNFTVNPSFSYLVDISHLEKGYHQIAINASIYFSTLDALHFNMTTSPYTFLVGETTTNPSTKPTLSTSPAVSPSPSLAPTSTPSSTENPTIVLPESQPQQPTLEPTLAPTMQIPYVNPPNTESPFIFLSIIIVASLMVGLAFHFKKRK